MSAETWLADVLLAGGVWLRAGGLVVDTWFVGHVLLAWVCVFSLDQLVYVTVCVLSWFSRPVVGVSGPSERAGYVP